MPMFDVRRDNYYISFGKQPCGFTFFLIIAFAIGNEQDLSRRMFMPVVSASWLKYDVTYRIASRFVPRD